MSWKNRWLATALIAVAALAYSQYRRRDLRRLLENFQRYSMPSATLYDAVTAPALRGFFTRVARELAELAPRARVLEVGSGPGRLAVTLAELAPEIQVTGVDISPEMVEMANALGSRSGVADRVAFQLGDVTTLPFPDSSFDLVVSTFSFHHWPNRSRGLTEIYRVLRPGGIARIYDVADWIRRFEREGPGIAELAQASPFWDHGTCTQRITTRLGPIPLVYRAELRREEPSATRNDEGRDELS